MSRLISLFIIGLLVAVPLTALAQQAESPKRSAGPQSIDFSDAILNTLIPEILYTAFVRLWYIWPVMIGFSILRRLVEGPRRR